MKIILTSTILTILLATNVFAHGHSSSKKVNYKICPIEICQETINHKHNGVTYHAHNYNDGHSYHYSNTKKSHH